MGEVLGWSDDEMRARSSTTTRASRPSGGRRRSPRTRRRPRAHERAGPAGRHRPAGLARSRLGGDALGPRRLLRPARRRPARRAAERHDDRPHRLARLRMDARYHRERRDIYRAKAYGKRPRSRSVRDTHARRRVRPASRARHLPSRSCRWKPANRAPDRPSAARPSSRRRRHARRIRPGRRSTCAASAKCARARSAPRPGRRSARSRRVAPSAPGPDAHPASVAHPERHQRAAIVEIDPDPVPARLPPRPSTRSTIRGRAMPAGDFAARVPRRRRARARRVAAGCSSSSPARQRTLARIAVVALHEDRLRRAKTQIQREFARRDARGVACRRRSASDQSRNHVCVVVSSAPARSKAARAARWSCRSRPCADPRSPHAPT